MSIYLNVKLNNLASEGTRTHMKLRRGRPGEVHSSFPYECRQFVIDIQEKDLVLSFGNNLYIAFVAFSWKYCFALKIRNFSKDII